MKIIRIIIILILLIQEIKGKNLTSICIKDFVAINMDSTLFETENEYDCYKEIPDYKKKIYGFRMKSECYIDSNLMYVDKGNIVSRCGQWIQIVGSSHKKIVCMIAGSRSIKSREKIIPKEVTPIYVNYNTFLFLTSSFIEVNDLTTPVTISETDVNLKINPSLYVINKKEEENTVTIQCIDSNRATEKVVIKGIEYIINEKAQYVIPYFKEEIMIILVSYDNERVDFHGVNFLKEKEKYETQHRYISNEMSQCTHVNEWNVYESRKIQNKGEYLTWQIWIEDLYENREMYDIDSEIEFSFPTQYTKTSFVYPSAININQEFQYFEMIYEINFNIEEYSHYMSNLAYQYEMKESNKIERNIITSRLPTKYYVEEDQKTIHLKVAFNKKINTFSNSVTIVHYLQTEELEGKMMKLKEAKFIPREEYRNQIRCPVESIDCWGYECTITKETKTWEKGCRPLCGVCRVGYICSTEGKCIKEENNNTRNSSISHSLLFLLLLLLSLL